MTNKEYNKKLRDQIIKYYYSDDMINEIAETYDTLEEKIEYKSKQFDEREDIINYKIPKAKIHHYNKDSETPIEIKTNDNNDNEPHITERLNNPFSNILQSTERIKNKLELEKESSQLNLDNSIKKDKTELYLIETVFKKADEKKTTNETIRYLIKAKYQIKARRDEIISEIGYKPEYDKSGKPIDPIALIDEKINELKNKVENETSEVKKSKRKITFTINKNKVLGMFREMYEQDIIIDKTYKQPLKDFLIYNCRANDANSDNNIPTNFTKGYVDNGFKESRKPDFMAIIDYSKLK